jgi:hypothetical protein
MMQWDPTLIISQIVALQCFYYLALGTLLAISHVVVDTPVSLDHFFSPHYTHFRSMNGWVDCICTLLASLAGAYFLSIVIEKAKKCVDFTCTLYLLHLAICSYYHVSTRMLKEWHLNFKYACCSIFQ